ncbi:hypothetical protein O1611_g166 [Lasiodiplodia mahajangana]|uniref:Uncharacterized protein n=1 Tax=Lasiodiplodia mahajangana TaxID=1108764 RepID=A0ACC2K1D2_9PEZI|nr:hypothetical protein O1611_g166 [Lasiodiplodia mahajangana]
MATTKTNADADLREGITLAIESLKIPSNNPRGSLARWRNLIARLLDMYEQKRNMQDLDLALSAADEALKVPNETDPELSALLWRVLRLLQATNQPVDAIHQYDINSLMGSWGNMLFNRYERLRDGRDLTEAIRFADEVVHTTPIDHPERAARLSSLSDMLMAKHELGKSMNDLDEAIKTARDAVAATSKSDTHLAGRKSNLGVLLMNKYRLTDDTEALKECTKCAKGALESTSEDEPGYASLLNNLMIILSSRQEDMGDLAETISRARKVSHSHYPLSPTFHNTLGNVLLKSYERTGNVEDLDEAISNVYSSIKASHEDHPDLAGRYSNLSSMFLRRYECKSEKKDLEEASLQARHAIAMTLKEHPALPGRLGNLSNILLRLFEHTREIKFLDEAIAIARTALNLALKPHGDLARLISDKRDTSLVREPPDNTRDAQRSTSKKNESFSTADEYHPEVANSLSNLGGLLFRKSLRPGNEPILDEAIEKTRTALRLSSPHDETSIRIQNNLGGMLLRKFKMTRDMNDLESAIDIATAAVNSTPIGHTERPSRLSSLSNMLWARYNHTKEDKDLNNAISQARQVVELLARRPNDALNGDLIRQLSNLSAMLLQRYDKTGDDRDLNEAISRTRNTINRIKDYQPHHVPQPGSSPSFILRQKITSMLKRMNLVEVVSTDLAIQFQNLSHMLLKKIPEDERPARFERGN